MHLNIEVLPRSNKIMGNLRSVAGLPGFEPGTTGSGERFSNGTNVKASAVELTTLLPMPPVDNKLLAGFESYLKDQVSRGTFRDYVNVVSKQVWPPKCKAHVRAWRKYVQFLFSIEKISWEQLQHYNAFLKTPKQKSILKTAVDESLILEYVDILRENELEYIALLLLGGARLSHIVYMLNTYSPDEIVKHPHGLYEPRQHCYESYCRYYLGAMFGSKKCDYIYYPRIKLEKQNLNYASFRTKIHKLGVQTKIFRKYVNQVLEQLAIQHNIRLDAVNLILSRELSVTGAHYLDTRSWADKLFSIYVDHLRQALRKTIY